MAIRAVFIGPPGCGKGSQAAFVVDRHSVAHISTGDLLRAAVKAGTELGQQISELMAQGNLVPDSVVLELIGHHLDETDLSNGFILDGFPRSIGQAEQLDSLLLSRKQPLTFVLHLHVDNEALIKRLSGRRTCLTCGRIFNVYFSPHAKDGVCDDYDSDCELMHRTDDNVDSIKHRLSVYEAQTKPLLDYYSTSGLKRTVEASRKVEEIAADIRQMIDTEFAD